MKPRLVFSVVLLALMAAILAACTSAQSSPRGTAASPTAQTETVQATILSDRMDMSQTTFFRGVRYTFVVINHGVLQQECMITSHPMGEVPMDQASSKALKTTPVIMPGTTEAFEYIFPPTMTPQQLQFNCYSHGQATVGAHLQLR